MEIEYESEYMRLGLKIAYYRKLRGLTQEQLTEKIDRNNQNIIMTKNRIFHQDYPV